jgi:K+-transporting ATPase ATPase C chain
MRSFIRQLRPALVAVLVFTVITGVLYPLLVTSVGQAAFHSKANGSLIERGGTVVGSSLIGQPFTSPQYFHPRPSAAGSGYDGLASSGTNLGPMSPDLLKAVADRAAVYRTENGMAADGVVPVDAVTSSASGLDPQISVANALLQAPRVAAARHVTVAAVIDLVHVNTDHRSLGFMGDDGVNVLRLNLALDAAGAKG